MRSKTGTVRVIEARHNFERKTWYDSGRSEPGGRGQPDEPSTRAFLGVESSVCGKRWRVRLDDDRLALALAQRLGLPEIVGRVLAARGVGPEEAEPLPRATVARPPAGPLQLLKDMDRAVGPPHGGARGRRADRRVRRLRRRRRQLGRPVAALLPGDRSRAAGLHPRPPGRRLRPQRPGAAQAEGAGRLPGLDPGLRHHRLMPPWKRRPRTAWT